VHLARKSGFRPIAVPLIEAVSGGFSRDKVKAIRLDELGVLEMPMTVKIVVFTRART
jgi:hypothetical protein